MANIIFDKNSFIQPPTPTDTLVFLLDNTNTLIFEIDPLDVINIFVQSLYVKIKTKSDIHILQFPNNVDALAALTLLQTALDYVRGQIQQNFGTNAILGLPTDGAYGGILGAIAGVTAGDRVEDAFDKIETLFGLLVPAKPVDLSTIIMVLTAAYSAREFSTGITRTTVTNVTIPTVTATDFFNGNAGLLTGFIDTIPVGNRILTTADDSGVYGALNIIDDSDPYIGQAGKAGFWKKLISFISPLSSLPYGLHTFSMTHSVSGTSTLPIYIDNPIAPSITLPLATSAAPSSWTSGVPHLKTSDSINFSATIGGAVGKFYNLNKVADVTGSTISTVNFLPIIPPLENAAVPVTMTGIVTSSAYSEQATFTINAYNSINNAVSSVINTNIRIDSNSVETRVQSGIGQYPIAFGTAFSSTGSILGNEELQLINNLYQFPPAIDYSTRYPVGPNYSTILGGSYLNMRWVTFDLGRITSQVGFQMTINNAQGFNGTIFGVDALQSNFQFQARVVSEIGGDVATVGWIDGNMAYPGVGSPTNDGDAALVVGSSHGTLKVVTFSTIKTGRLYVRLGIHQANSKKFSSVTKI